MHKSHSMCLVCQPVVAKSGLERAGNINLHYPPLVIHFLIAQNLWPRSCYRENLSRGSKICGACTKQAGSRHKQASLQLLDCYIVPPNALATWLSGVHGIYRLSAGSTPVHTVPSAGSALCTKMPARHIHQNALCSHQNPSLTNAGQFSHKWHLRQSSKYRIVPKMTKQISVPYRWFHLMNRRVLLLSLTKSIIPLLLI